MSPSMKQKPGEAVRLLPYVARSAAVGIPVVQGGEDVNCGKTKSLPAESPSHTNDWEQVLMWVENGPPGMDVDVVEPGLDDEDEEE